MPGWFRPPGLIDRRSPTVAVQNPSDRFIEVFVNTPLEVCERRDTKGLYARARRGEIQDFTGINDPYEAPCNAEITLDTVAHTPQENAKRIIDYLSEKGFVRDDGCEGGKSGSDGNCQGID